MRPCRRAVPPSRPPRRALRPAIIITLLVALLPGVVPAAAQVAWPPVRYESPVDVPVAEPFAPPPPERPWAPGNRGVDFDTKPGTTVRAMADGEVVFAGQVGGTLHVTIAHADGLRTSYSFLVALTVAPGQRLRRGESVGITGPVLHVGARLPDGTYLDPAALWSGAPRVELVPGGDDGAPSGPLGEGEYRAFSEVVDAAWTRTGMPTRLCAAQAMASWAVRQLPAAVGARSLEAAVRWHRQSRACTHATTPPPPLAGRRIAVLAGGLGSSSEDAGIDQLDTSALGYLPDDVVRFSYLGGRVRGAPEHAARPPAPGSLAAALPVRDYGAHDSQRPLSEAGRDLAAVLRVAIATQPGVPLDVLAHSQGGIVARLALDELARQGVELPAGSTVVTLGTPHAGSDLATGLAIIRADGGGDRLLEEVRARFGASIDPASPAVRDLAEGSAVVRQLASARLPGGVTLRSVAARGDLVVPNERSSLPSDRGANTVVSLSGPRAHDALPADPAAHREIALALAGLPPTCRSLADALVDQATSETVSAVEDRLLLGAAGLVWPS